MDLEHGRPAHDSIHLLDSGSVLNVWAELYLLAAGHVQGLGQLPEVVGHLFQKHFEAVPDHMDLLLGLRAAAALRVQQQLQGHVLQRGHLQLRVQELLPDLLQRCSHVSPRFL